MLLSIATNGSANSVRSLAKFAAHLPKDTTTTTANRLKSDGCVLSITARLGTDNFSTWNSNNLNSDGAPDSGSGYRKDPSAPPLLERVNGTVLWHIARFDSSTLH